MIFLLFTLIFVLGGVAFKSESGHVFVGCIAAAFLIACLVNS